MVRQDFYFEGECSLFPVFQFHEWWATSLWPRCRCRWLLTSHISLKFALWRKGEFNFSTTCAAVSQSDHRIKRLWWETSASRLHANMNELAFWLLLLCQLQQQWCPTPRTVRCGVLCLMMCSLWQVKQACEWKARPQIITSQISLSSSQNSNW